MDNSLTFLFCYDGGIPIFFSIVPQYLIFLRYSGLWLHNQFCLFFALIKIVVYDQELSAVEPLRTIMTWFAIGNFLSAEGFYTCRCIHHPFSKWREQMTVTSPFIHLCYPWRLSIHLMASVSLTFPRYLWVVCRLACRNIIFDTISMGVLDLDA